MLPICTCVCTYPMECEQSTSKVKWPSPTPLSSHQLPITPPTGVGFGGPSPIHARILTLSCAGHIQVTTAAVNCYSQVRSCPETLHTILPALPFFSTPLPKIFVSPEQWKVDIEDPFTTEHSQLFMVILWWVIRVFLNHYPLQNEASKSSTNLQADTQTYRAQWDSMIIQQNNNHLRSRPRRNQKPKLFMLNQCSAHHETPSWL